MQLFPHKKFKIVLSDFHLGKGKHLPDGARNLLEDFTSDHKFIEFLDYHMKGPYKRAEVELIFNGDFLNLLQVDYRDRYTDFITEADSLHKLMKILRGHSELFDKLSEFSRESNHKVIFILGNHDPGLLWEGVQHVLKERLGGEVKFFMEAYDPKGVHIEHGNQYQADNRYDRENYFLKENVPEPIINLPFGSFLVIHYLNEIKKERPYIDKVYPFRYYQRWALIHDTMFALKSLFKLAFWFFGFILRKNPARTISFKQVVNILKETTVHPRLAKEAKRILLNRKECKIVVFGHTHQCQHRNFGLGKDYFNTGTWNEKISLDVGTLGRILRLTYVQIEYDKFDSPFGILKEWKGHTDVAEEVLI